MAPNQIIGGAMPPCPPPYRAPMSTEVTDKIHDFTYGKVPHKFYVVKVAKNGNYSFP